ncbi:hypothetical protein CW751_07755 [Brumimicrobium salinarum]|uniref:Uncharacterized protein n=1 Tax=Brumimicrobium salinarum TaxID=2058658 RepID=A0A2I0R260_9FLAO|nr:hypothetical protein [Brumimicrobium salinarum]PKR80656.1 hypothetical protein CW751_07755 [Brumimicrobium salinarum]
MKIQEFKEKHIKNALHGLCGAFFRKTQLMIIGIQCLFFVELPLQGNSFQPYGNALGLKYVLHQRPEGAAQLQLPPKGQKIYLRINYLGVQPANKTLCRP